MFFFYIIWFSIFYILNYTHIFLENIFFKKNNTFFLLKRTFKYISYFEKIFLVLFYKKGWFEESIAHLYDKKNILIHRRNNYPIINSFHTKLNKVYYNLIDLNLVVKQYNYYYNNFFYRKLIVIFNVFFKKSKNNFIKFLMIQNLFIKKYYNLNSYNYFKDNNNNNTIKFNNLFNLFLLNSKNKLKFFNLDKWDDWFKYHYSNDVKKILKIKKNIKFKLTREYFTNEIKIYNYKVRLRNFNKKINKKFYNIYSFKENLNNFFKIKINTDFKKLLNYYNIKFSESSISKYINTSNLKLNSVYYLRKNRIFNKGRYSRNRQLYRTGVYWCLWLNIIMVYGLYFIFYRFTFNFGYFWWGLLFLAYSTIFSRILKYNFFKFNYLLKEFKNLISWFGFLINSLINFLINLLISFFKFVSYFNFINIYKKLPFNNFYNSFFSKFSMFFKKLINNRKRIKLNYIWQGMKEKDNSFLRYKTLIHWIGEFYKIITY